MWVTVDGGTTRAAPCARGKHSATLLGGYVYVLGGRGAGGSVPLRDFWRYCLATCKWERVEARGETPPALQEHSATSHVGKLYVFGGEAGALNDETPLWIYDTELEAWQKLAGNPSSSARRRGTALTGAGEGGAGPRGRRGHSAHALKDCLLIYGGYMDLRGSTNELWAFHYESQSWQQVRTAGAGPARHRHAAAVHDGRLYVHGGQCDLRDCADLWHYDIVSRVWRAVRTPAKAAPSARSGHGGVRAGAHMYIFGGETRGHPTNELWRFHFATETWEQITHNLKWPSARVDSRVILIANTSSHSPHPTLPSAHPPSTQTYNTSTPQPPPTGFLREISKLSSFHIRRAARCSYSALAADRDSTESLLRADRNISAIAKSRSAYLIDERQPADGEDDDQNYPNHTLPKSASVRFTKEEVETDTSDYASAEGVNRSVGFSNPHYLGPDVRKLGAALTPDSGVAAGDIELVELRGGREVREARDIQEVRGIREVREVHLLVVGGREVAHPALLQSPLSMWSYRLL